MESDKSDVSREKEKEVEKESTDKNRKRIRSSDENEPIFVPHQISAKRKALKSWIPMCDSSKQLMNEFAKRAKNSALSSVPESRREDVITTYNRVLLQYNNRVNCTVFPKPLYSTDSINPLNLSTYIGNQEKQNALLLSTSKSLVSDIHTEQDKIQELQREITAVSNEIEELDQQLEEFNENHNHPFITASQTEKEECVVKHRQSANSVWRRPNQSSYNEDNEWWDKLEDVVNERFQKEKPLRSVVKRLAVVDTKLNSQLHPDAI